MKNQNSTIDRRRLIATAALAPVAGVPLAGLASGQNTDMHVQWHQDWKQAMHDFEVASEMPGGGNGSSPAEDDAYHRSWEASEKICMTPADTLEGVEAQLAHFVESFGEYCLNNVGGNLDGQLIQNALDSIRRINGSVKA